MQNSVASDNSAASRGFLGSPANVLRPPGLFRDLMDLLPTDLLAPTSQSNPQEAPGPRSSGLGSGGSGEALTITNIAKVTKKCKHRTHCKHYKNCRMCKSAMMDGAWGDAKARASSFLPPPAAQHKARVAPARADVLAESLVGLWPRRRWAC